MKKHRKNVNDRPSFVRLLRTQDLSSVSGGTGSEDDNVFDRMDEVLGEYDFDGDE